MLKKVLHYLLHVFKLIWRFIMAMFSVNPHRQDPYKNFKFRVKWDGKYIPGISKVSPLKRVTETVIHRDGGEGGNDFSFSPGTTRFEPIVLERGLTHDTAFEEWANLVYSINGDHSISLKSYKKDIIIDLFNLQGSLVMSFRVYRCWVAEYQPLAELDANNGSVALERIVLQHEGWERDQEVTEPTES